MHNLGLGYIYPLCLELVQTGRCIFHWGLEARLGLLLSHSIERFRWWIVPCLCLQSWVLVRIFAEWLIGFFWHKQVYYMDVGRLGGVLVVCAVICAMRLGCIQAWRYQHNIVCSFNLKLNQDNYDLLVYWAFEVFFIALMRWWASSVWLALIPTFSTQRINNVGQIWCFHKPVDSQTGKYPWGDKSLTRLSKARQAARFNPYMHFLTSY